MESPPVIIDLVETSPILSAFDMYYLLNVKVKKTSHEEPKLQNNLTYKHVKLRDWVDGSTR